MIVTKSDPAATAGERFTLYRAPAPLQAATFADDVRAGLSAAQKRLSPKYFYDELGSALFEAICELPEYYLTRAESEILERYGDDIVAALDEPLEFVELGSGSGRKTRLLIEAALRNQEYLDYHPVDISPSALIAASTSLAAAFDRLRVSAYASDYFDVLAARRVRTARRTLTLFLGSNIGNYEPPQALSLLRAVSGAFSRGDALLLGTDLKKDPAILERAYDDATGVTAAFDKNLLGRINRDLGGDFDLRAFDHEARYDADRGVVESFLVAQRAQTVSIEAIGLTVGFEQGERIHTESSYKFSASDVAGDRPYGRFRSRAPLDRRTRAVRRQPARRFVRSTRPLIGITTRIAHAEDGSLHPNVAPYVASVQRAGGEALVLANDVATVDSVLAKCDGIVLSGGSDVDPQHYGAQRDPHTETPNPPRDEFELALVRGARERGVPILCICRGLQVANVAFGGTLVQHLPDVLGPNAAIEHSQTEVYALNREEYSPGHVVRLRAGSALAALVGRSEFSTNSMHHQAVAEAASCFTVAGATDDGVVEALDAAFEHPFFVAVQWHPEALPAEDPISAALFAGLIAAARGALVK